MQNWDPLECHIVAFVISLTLQNGTFQVLAMTVDKYIAIKWPHKAAVYITPRRAVIISIVTYICVASYNITNLFISTLIGNECVGYAKGGVITTVYSWFVFAISGLLSLILLIYFNSVTITGSLESANSSILAARRLFKEVVGKKSGFYVN